jgi:hypothetical protein
LRRATPDARFEGVTVEPMVHGGVETIVGMTRDPSFGPVVLFGLGGVAVELLRDVSLRVAPLTDRDAEEMVREIRGYPLLNGYRAPLPQRRVGDRPLAPRVAARIGSPGDHGLDLNPIIVFQGDAHASRWTRGFVLRRLGRSADAAASSPGGLSPHGGFFTLAFFVPMAYARADGRHAGHIGRPRGIPRTARSSRWSPPPSSFVPRAREAALEDLKDAMPFVFCGTIYLTCDLVRFYGPPTSQARSIAGHPALQFEPTIWASGSRTSPDRLLTVCYWLFTVALRCWGFSSI